MTLARLTLVVFIFAVLAGCSGTVELACDEVQTYQLAVDSKRVEVPEDLDALEPLREMPLPEASPQPPRPPNSPCIDLPPGVTIGSS